MKRVLMGVLTAVLLVGGFALAGGAATAEQPPAVHHPECAELVEDIAPGVATPIAGIVYVKAGNEAALEACEPEVEYSPWVGQPTCGQNGYTVTRTKTLTPYIWDGSQFVAAPPVVTKEERTVPVWKFEPCPTSTTTPEPEAQVGVLPPTAPPTTGAPQVAPAAATPPAAASPPAAAPPVTQLPETGSSQWVIALLAMVSLGAGVALTRLSRRSA